MSSGHRGASSGPATCGDNTSDIVWYNGSTGATEIWFMKGDLRESDPFVVDENGRQVFIGPPSSIVGAQVARCSALRMPEISRVTFAGFSSAIMYVYYCIPRRP